MSYAANAYRKTSQIALTPRAAEAAVLMKAAGKLQPFSRPDVGSSPALNEALVFNQRVWTVIAAAVADPANALPDEIKGNVTNIAVFVFRTIVDAMIEPTARKLDTLVSLNQTIAAGLQSGPGTP